MIKRILLPTDGSDTANQAADWAFDLAERYGAELHVLTNLEELPEVANPARVEDLIKQQRHNAQEMVDEIAARAENRGLDTKTSVLGSADPDQAILDYCDDHEVDMIVMGTHGRSGLNRLLLGSTTERTLRSSPVPVVVVPKREEEQEATNE